MTTPFFTGECLLLGWSDTSTRGKTVTLLLNEDEEVHPFKHLSADKKAGQRMMVVCVLLGEDEKPALMQSQLAAVLCKSPDFQRFLNDRSFYPVEDEEQTRAALLMQCGISSRRELDTDAAARIEFELLVQQFKDASRPKL